MKLLPGSFLWKLPLILSFTIIVIEAQYYDSDYRVKDDLEDEDHSSYESDEHDSHSSRDSKPDYSKYYSSDKSLPITLDTKEETKEDGSGFVKPIDFSGLFGPDHFGFGSASSPIKDGFTGSLAPFGLEVSETKHNHSGFVQPSEFRPIFDISSSASESGFRPQDFIAVGNKDKLASASFEQPDFFVSSFKKYEETPGPNYISHKIPSSEAYKKSSTEQKIKYQPQKVKKVAPKPTKGYVPEEVNLDYKTTVPSFHEKKSGYTVPEYATLNSDFESSVAPFSSVPPTEFRAAKSAQQFLSQPYLAKSSFPVPATLQTLSIGPQYYPQGSAQNIKTKYLPSAVTPYQKYSFQPTNFHDVISSPVYPSSNTFKLTSTAASFLSPQKEEAGLLKNKNCKMVEKQIDADSISKGRFKRQAMTCFVCTDPKSGGNYEQCSYTSDPNEKSYFSGSAEKYSSGTASSPTVSTYRFRRYAEERSTSRKRKSRQQEKEEADLEDPYGFSELKKQKFKSRPSEFESKHSPYSAPDFGEYQKEATSYGSSPEYFSFDPAAEERSYSEIQSEELKKNGENCKKVKRDSLTCMVCENPKTGGNYEQCSYTSEPNEKKYAYVKEHKFDSNDEPADEKEQESTDEKPILKESLQQRPQNNRRPQTFQRNRASPSNHREDVTRSNKEICKDVKRDSMTCTVCKNPKTGGTNEKCSYRSEPNPKKYSYVNERTYNSKDRPEDDKSEEETEIRPLRTRERLRSSPSEPRQKSLKKRDDKPFGVPYHFADNTKKRERYGVKPGGLGLQPDLYGEPDTYERTEEEEKGSKEKETEAADKYEGANSDPSISTSYEDHFSKLFPEYVEMKKEEGGHHGAASEKQENPEFNYQDFFADSSKKDVEEVLAEFAKKDRSKCKKVTKDKLTCYLCVDEKGMQNEECMYVTESQPQSSHLAYHTVKQFRSVPENRKTDESSVEETQVVTSEPQIAPASPSSSSPPASSTSNDNLFTTSTANPLKKRKGFFKKVPTTSSTETYSTTTEKDKKHIKTRRVLKRTPTLKFESEIVPETSTVVSKAKNVRQARRTTNLRKPVHDSVSSASGTHYVYEKPPESLKREIRQDSKSAPESAESRQNKKEVASDVEPEYPTPDEFKTEGADGAFASELKPIFSKRFGVTLPKFMLQRSEHEASFDETVAGGI